MKIVDVLRKVDELPISAREKGTFFERLIAKYLMTDPEYANRLEKVWLWGEWDECPNETATGGR